MPKNIRLTVVTPRRLVFDQEVEMAVIAGSEGEMGIMAEHAPTVTPLKVSVLRWRQDRTFHPIAITAPGFLEIKPDQITVLADNAELPAEIDTDRAKNAKERAENRLAGAGENDIDFNRAELALRRAIARIRTAEKSNS